MAAPSAASASDKCAHCGPLGRSRFSRRSFYDCGHLYELLAQLTSRPTMLIRSFSSHLSRLPPYVICGAECIALEEEFQSEKDGGRSNLMALPLPYPQFKWGDDKE